MMDKSRGSKIWQDLDANCLKGGTSRPTFAERVRNAATLRYAAILLHRVASALGTRSGFLAGVVKQMNQLITGADIAWQAKIGEGAILFHPQGVVIGPFVTAGPGLIVQQGVTLGGMGQSHREAIPSPTLGADVQVGAGARVLGSVRIGDRSKIGANAVVLRDVPPDHVAVGIPARNLAPKAARSEAS